MSEKKRALILNDNETQNRLLKKSLENLDFDVTAITVPRSQNWTDFLIEHKTLLESHISLSKLVITDFEMGIITGKDILKFFFENNFSNILVCYTGDVGSGKEMRTKYDSIYLKKPCFNIITELKKITSSIK